MKYRARASGKPADALYLPREQHDRLIAMVAPHAPHLLLYLPDLYKKRQEIDALYPKHA